MTSVAHLGRDPNGTSLRLVLHDDRQERVRKLLLHYCVPRIPGQTAWEIAGAILIALDAVCTSPAGLPEFQRREERGVRR